MILYIKGADFSNANISAEKTFRVTTNIGSGVSHTIPVRVSEGQSVQWTLTVSDNYTLDEVNVTMGGSSITPTINENTITITIPNVTGAITVLVATTKNIIEGGEPDGPVGDYGEYESYIGSDYYPEVGYRVSYNSDSGKWSPSISGSTSAGTDYLPVSSNDLIWINYVAVVNNSLGSGGFYNENKEFVAPLYWGTFGLDQASLASSKFVTPDNPVTISDIEEKRNCNIKYVKFTAWSAANNSDGFNTTEARIYRKDEIVEKVYTEYIGDDAFTVNKYNLPINNGVASETFTGSESAWATDYIPVNINKKIWLQYIFTMSDAHSCIGIYNSSKELIYSVRYSDFGLSSGDKFKTPTESIAISSVVPEGADVAYVRFIAWDTSSGGRSNTAARIYE